MAFDFNWAQPKLNLQIKGPQAPVYQQPAPQQSQVMQDFMDAERLGGWTNPKQVQPQVPQQPDPAVQRQQQIDSIKSRIQQLESQIAANQAKLKSWQGVDGQIAAIEARKINSQDPTAIWRWKENAEQAARTRMEDMERINKEKELNDARAKQNVANKVANTLATMKFDLSTSPEQAQQHLNTLGALMTEAQNAGIDTKSITDAIAKYNGPLPYNTMTDLMDEMEYLEANFDKEGEFGSSRDFNTYQQKMEDLWNSSSPEMRANREFKNKYESLLTKRRPNKKTNPKRRPK